MYLGYQLKTDKLFLNMILYIVNNLKHMGTLNNTVSYNPHSVKSDVHYSANPIIWPCDHDADISYYDHTVNHSDRNLWDVTNTQSEIM